MKSRKLLAILMVSVMLLGSFATVGAAADTTASSIDDHLVVHYDFEGLTKEEAMKDKAPAGTTKDNLSVIDHQNVGGASSYINFDLDNGTVKRTRVWTQLTAAVSEDILSLADKATVFIRFKFPTLDQNYPMLDLYNKTDSINQIRCTTIGTGMETKFVGGSRTSTNYLAYQVACNDMRTTDKFVNMVITYDFKKTSLGDGAYTGKILYYASVGDLNADTDWFAIGDKTPTNNANSLIASTDELVFTILGYADGTAGKTDMIFDDIRIYNTVLTEDEIATIRIGDSTSAGGNTEGGNTEGGNTEGGNTEGGNTEGGNTTGGNTTGGNTEGDNTTGDNNANNTDETEAETTAKAEETTAKAAETEKTEEGCGAVVGGVGILAASALCATFVTRRKRK